MDVEAADSVTSVINYVLPTEEPLYHYNLVEPPDGKPVTNEVSDPQAMEIRNLRRYEPSQLDIHGFELVPFLVSVDDIYDPVQVEESYYPQAIDLVKRHTGASRVHCFIPFCAVQKRSGVYRDRSPIMLEQHMWTLLRKPVRKPLIAYSAVRRTRCAGGALP